jgi:hypothetical protein
MMRKFRFGVDMPIIELLTSSTAATVAKYLIEKIIEFKKSKPEKNDSELEVLKNKLESYKEKTQLMEKELDQFKDIAKKLESRLGEGYVSEGSYVDWNFKTIKPRVSAFKVEIWTEEGDFHPGTKDIRVIPRTNNYRIGDKINLYFRAEKDCYLTLLNHGTSGRMTVLLPNSISKNNFIKGGSIYAIPGEDYPFDYVLSGPAGTEKIKAIATLRKTDLIDLMYNNGEIFSTSKAAAKDINVVARKIESTAPEEWAEAVYEFEVK